MCGSVAWFSYAVLNVAQLAIVCLVLVKHVGYVSCQSQGKSLKGVDKCLFLLPSDNDNIFPSVVFIYTDLIWVGQQCYALKTF